MGSQTVVFEVFEKLSSFNENDIKNEVGHFLPVLIICLKSTDTNASLAVQSASALFRQCLPCLSDVDTVEACVFSQGLPAIQNLFIESMQGISEQLGTGSIDPDMVDVISSLLQVCLSLLENIESCINFTRSEAKLVSSRVKHLLTNTNRILKVALQHCYESQQLYGVYVEQLTILAEFFRKTNDLLFSYVMILKDVVTFNCKYEDQLDLMLDVLKFVGSAGQLSTCLGVRVMSESWKLFASLTSSHAQDLHGMFALADPLTNLVSEISRISQNTVDKGGDEKWIERNLKVASFLLRIVIKLCEQFAAELEASTRVLVDLLLILNKNSSLCLCLCGAGKQWHVLLDRHLVVGAEPLIKILITSHHFSVEVLQPREDMLVAQLLLLKCVVMQLQGQPRELRNHWLGVTCFTDNIFMALLTTADKCSAALSCNTMDGSSGQSLGTKLYNELVVTTASLALDLCAAELPACEHALLALLSLPHYSGWQCLLVCDIWVSFAHIMGASLVHSHLQCLVRMLKQPSVTLHREVFISLVNRLLSVLPANQETTQFNMVDVRPAAQLPASKDRLYRHILDKYKCDDCKCKQVEFCQSLYELSYIAAPSVKPFVPSLVQVWGCIDGVFQYDVTKHLISVSCTATSQMSNYQLLLTLKGMTNLNGANLKLLSVQFLSRLASLKLPSDDCQLEVCSQISQLYAQLLLDKDYFVHRAALESFAEFAQVTSHENIVAGTVHGSAELQQIVSMFLQGRHQDVNHDSVLFVRRLALAKFASLGSASEKLKPCRHGEAVKVNESEEKPTTSLNETLGDDSAINEPFCCDDSAMSESLYCDNTVMDKTYGDSAINKSLGADNHHRMDSTQMLVDDANNYMDETVQELILQIDSNTDTLLLLYEQSLLSQESVLQVKKVMNKLNIMCDTQTTQASTQQIESNVETH